MSAASTTRPVTLVTFLDGGSEMVDAGELMVARVVGQAVQDACAGLARKGLNPLLWEIPVGRIVEQAIRRGPRP
jgi:hypothetical protein